MVNATGRAARKNAATATTAAPDEASTEAKERKERHVRTPLERAEAAAEKAAATLAKLQAKQAEAQKAVDELAPAVEEAQVVADYTAGHPLLVAKRKAEATPTLTEVPAGDFADGSEIVSTVDTSDVEDDDDTDGTGEGADGPVPSFDFESALANNQDPFAQAAGPNTTQV